LRLFAAKLFELKIQDVLDEKVKMDSENFETGAILFC
jgi:hypothetical protein